MTPKKVVPKGTDDIIELTDIVEPGVLPNESAGAGLTDATFEDELDSMLADAPELSAAAKDMGAAPEAGSSPAAPAAAEDDEFADLDSLLDDLGDDLSSAKPPAPKAPPSLGVPAAESAVPEETLLDVDDLLAEVGAGDTAAFADKAPAAEGPAPAAEDNGVDVDEFLAAFEATDSAAQPASPQVIDAAALDADALLAELQAEPPPQAEEDDLLAELKSVMGGDLAETPVAESSGGEEVPAPDFDVLAAELDLPAAEPELEAVAAEPELAPEQDMTEPDLAGFDSEIAQPEPEFGLDEVAAAEEVALPADDPSADPALDLIAELAPEMPADEALMAMAAAEDTADAVVPDAPQTQANEEGVLADEDLQHLDALLDDILQPTAGPVTPTAPAAPTAPAEEVPLEILQSAPEDQVPVAAEIPPPPAPEPACAAVVDADELLAGLMAEDGPLLSTVRDMVRQEMESRLAALEERLAENLDKAAAKAAAQVIREEIAALAQDMD